MAWAEHPSNRPCPVKILTIVLANVLALNVWTVLGHMRKGPTDRFDEWLNLLMEEKFVTEDKAYSKRFQYRQATKRLRTTSTLPEH